VSDTPAPGRTGAGAATKAILVVYALALALWAGGLAVLGAVVAATVFRIVPAPTSADAMTVVFRRFDALAMACAAISLLSEAGLAWRGARPIRADVARAAATVVAAVLAIIEGVHLSPAIQALHRDGAVRGYGDAGMRLEALHRLAETSAKAELVLLTTAFVLLVLRAARASEPRPATSP
jgi:hypothetical protein